MIDNDDEDDDVPLLLRRAPSHSGPSSSTCTSLFSSSASLSDSGDSDDETACSICLGQPTDVAVLDSCSHSFCFLCIFRWCTDICNNCPLCKRRVTQITHHADNRASTDNKQSSSREVERRDGETGVKQEHKRSDAEERKMEEEEEADEAADEWALIQTQRAENQMKQAARRRGRRHGGTSLSQLSLEASPSSLVEGIEAIAAIGHSESVPLTRQMVKQKVAEQQQIIGRTQSTASSHSVRPSSLLTLRSSPSDAAAAASTDSSPTSASTNTTPASTVSLSPRPSAAGLLVVHIPDRQQRVSYDEGEEVPSPSILNIACELCFTDENEHLLLLCDGCDDAYHTYCLRPRLDSIPEDEWFCPNCLHDAQLQPSEEQKEVSDFLSNSPNAASQFSITPRRSRGRAQRLGMRVSPAIRQRLTETPQTADSLDDDYRPNGGAGRFDIAPIPLSFTSIRPGRTPRAMHRRRSMRQEQLRRQALESQRQQQEQQARLRAERAAKRREHSMRPCEGGDESDESDDISYRSSTSPLPNPSIAPARYAVPTAPLSSLHQLSSSQGETLAQRLRDIEMKRLREREADRERKATRMEQHGFIEQILDDFVQNRDKDNSGTGNREQRRRNNSKRKVQHENGRGDEDEWSSGSGRVRRKVANMSKSSVEPIIVTPNSSSRQQAGPSAAMAAAASFSSRSSALVTLTAMPAASAPAAIRLSPFSASPNSSPPSSLSSLPHPLRSAHPAAFGHLLSSAVDAPRAAKVGLSAALSAVASTPAPTAVVPPARFPYTAPVLSKRSTAFSTSPPSSTSSSSSVPPSSSWTTSTSPSSAVAAGGSSTSTAGSVPPVLSFEEFERSRSHRTSRSPYRGASSPQQQRHHHKQAEKARVPMRRSTHHSTAAKHGSEFR